MLEEGLLRALTRGGETDPALRSARAAIVSASVLGVNLVSKITAGDADEIRRLIESMEAEVRVWQALG